MRHAILVVLVALVGHTLFIGRGDSAEEAAKRSIQALNARDYPAMWDGIATQSKQELATQLNNNRANPLGRMLIAHFGIPESEIDGLTPYTYFVAIMRFAEAITPPEEWESRFRRIEVEGDCATVHWDKRSTSGTSQMVREEGEWKVVGTVY